MPKEDLNNDGKVTMQEKKDLRRIYVVYSGSLERLFGLFFICFCCFIHIRPIVFA